eukprot:CAMPEP_0172500980 /NCGR_PEP_ID=MMETSP1066-20121228/144895_1 /TAXON_ID=671091 /ORGANISM="Coscinodiscus wailesii, Strain CCMP2513" /LENGTH=173 /DNA_ID=CAMNT_0013275523 /DNA_START=34 /DNA_END=555 /DNA_ORIENTATION=-
MTIPPLSTIVLISFLSLASSFVPSPSTFHLPTITKSVTSKHHALPLSTLQPSILLSTNGIPSDNIPTNAGFEDAFTDEISLFDPVLAIVFGIVLLVVLGVTFTVDKMDDAIGKVLVEFETTMKDKYRSRWVSIEAKLDGLGDVERSQRLFAIMEELQESEPEFMARVKRDMGS